MRYRRGCFGLPAALRNRNLLAAVPWRMARRLASGMRELNCDCGLRVLAHRGEDRLQRGFGGVVPRPETTMRDATDGFHPGSLDAEHRGARQCETVDVGKMP